MSFHPELLVNHLVKEFLPEKPKMVKLIFKTRTGTKRGYIVDAIETRIVDIIDEYDEYEPVGYKVKMSANYDQKIITDHLFRHAQITLRGLKKLGYLVNGSSGKTDRGLYRIETNGGQKEIRIDYVDVEARVFNKIEWWEDKSLLECESAYRSMERYFIQQGDYCKKRLGYK